MSLGIKYKASIPVILLALMLVSFTGLSIYFMGKVESTTESLARRHHELEQVQRIETATSELVFPHLHHLTSSAPNAKQHAASIFANIDAYVSDLYEMKVVHEEERELLEFISEKIRAAKPLSQQIFEYQGNNHHHYMQLLNELSKSHLEPIRTTLVKWHVEEALEVKELNQAADAKLHNYIVGAMVVLALAIVMVGFTLWFNHIILIRPVLDITRTTNLLTTGNFNEKTTVHSQDELGKLAHNINDMATSLDRMYCEINKQARTDRLTGILNRMAMEEILQHELASAQRNKHALSIAVFDLDHFKTVNDRFGHPVGDKVLQAVTDIVLQSIRRCDYFFRYGGEEFLLLFPHTDTSMATKVLERCRKAIAAHSLIIDTYRIPVTASFGLAEYQDDSAEMETLITQADEALYTAKNTGRNRIVDYSSVILNQLKNQAS
jgi:diguanylate cyclase (GGDEF)-like protein